MSRKRNSHPFALVYWTESNEISVLDSRCVVDPEMLRDFNKIGMIEFGEPSITAPPEGWPMFLGKVLAVSDDESKLRKLEDDFIRNGRLKYGSQSSQSESSNINKNKRRKMKGSDVSQPETVERRTRRSTAMDKQDLIKRIGVLEEQLESEKEKNRQLVRFNIQLQEDLPRLIEDAMKTISSTYSFKKIDSSNGNARQDIGQVTKSSIIGQVAKISNLGQLTKSCNIGQLTKSSNIGQLTKSNIIGQVTKISNVQASAGDAAVSNSLASSQQATTVSNAPKKTEVVAK